MALELFIVETQSGRILAEVPGTPGGPLSREAGGFASASFSIHLSDPTMPASWEELLAEQKHSVLAVDEQGSTRTPVWLGIINERSVKDGGAQVQCVSTEWLLDARRTADRIWGTSTDLMRIVRDLVADFEADGLGASLATDAPDIGTQRAWSVKRSEGKSPAKCFDELGIEWSVELSWASPDQAEVRKTLRARKFEAGVLPAPKRVIQVPMHTTSWEWTASRLESESATVVFVEGDGSGDLRTVSLPVVDAAREAAGYPRVEAWESVSGVTNAAEAGQLAAQFAARKFARHERIQLTAHNSADGSPLAGLVIGDAIRVSIDTDSLQREAVYRLASWDLDPSGATWTPILVPAEFGLEGWRRPGAKSAALAARQEAKKQQATSQDPLKNGYEWEGSKIDPEKGFQIKGEDGEWGGIGGGGGFGSSNILGTVDTVIYAPDGKVNIVSGTETIQAIRSRFYQPAAGDEVAVGSFGGQPVLLTPVTQDTGEGGGGTTDPGEPTPHPGVVKLQLESGWVNTDINQYGLPTATLDKNQWVIWTGSIVANVAMPAGSIVTRLPASHTTPVEGWMSYFRFLQNGDVVTTVSIAANTVIHLSSIVYQTRSSGLTNSFGIAWGVDGDSTAFFMGLSSSSIGGLPNPRYAYVPVSKSEGDASRPFYTIGKRRDGVISFAGPWSSMGSGMPARYSTEANTRNWTQLTLENGWNQAGEGGANGYEGGGGPFQLAKNKEGVVTFSGAVHLGVLNARICVIPKGFRPKFTTVFPSSGGTSGVRIEPDGSVFRADSSSGTVSANHAMWHADH